METQLHSEREVDLALRRYDVALRYLAALRQMTWTKTRFFLTLNLGLLTLTGALARIPVIGTDWISSHASKVVAATGLVASVLWGLALRQNAKDVDRSFEVCHALEPVALEQHPLLQSARKGRVLSTHGILALFFLFIWVDIIIKTQVFH
jgi:hypothetical protein